MARLAYEMTAHQESVLIQLDQRIPKIVEDYIFKTRKTNMWMDTVSDRYHWSEAKALDRIIEQLEKPPSEFNNFASKGYGSWAAHSDSMQHITNLIMSYLDRKYDGLVNERKLVDHVIDKLREGVDTLRCMVEFPRALEE